MIGWGILLAIIAAEFLAVVHFVGWEQPAPAIFQVVGSVTAMIGGVILVRRVW